MQHSWPALLVLSKGNTQRAGDTESAAQPGSAAARPQPDDVTAWDEIQNCRGAAATSLVRLSLLVRTSSGTGVDAGGCFSRASDRDVCGNPPRIGTPASDRWLPQPGKAGARTGR
jgi:hypothetical protein